MANENFDGIVFDDEPSGGATPDYGGIVFDGEENEKRGNADGIVFDDEPRPPSLMERLASGDIDEDVKKKEREHHWQDDYTVPSMSLFGMGMGRGKTARNYDDKAKMDDLAEIAKESGLEDWQVRRIRSGTATPDEMREALAYVARNRVASGGEAKGEEESAGLKSVPRTILNTAAKMASGVVNLAGTLAGGVDEEARQTVMVDNPLAKNEGESFDDWLERIDIDRKAKLLAQRNPEVRKEYERFFKWEAPIAGKEGMHQERSVVAENGREGTAVGNFLVGSAKKLREAADERVPVGKSGSSVADWLENAASGITQFSYLGPTMIATSAADAYQQTRSAALESGANAEKAEGLASGQAAFDGFMTGLFYIAPFRRWMHGKGIAPVETVRNTSFSEIAKGAGRFAAKREFINQGVAAIEASGIMGAQNAGDMAFAQLASGQDLDLGEITVEGLKGVRDGIAIGAILGAGRIVNARIKGAKEYERSVRELIKTSDGAKGFTQLYVDATADFLAEVERGGVPTKQQADKAGLPPMSVEERINYAKMLHSQGINADMLRRQTKIGTSESGGGSQANPVPPVAPTSGPDAIADKIRSEFPDQPLAKFNLPQTADGKPNLVQMKWKDNATGRENTDILAYDPNTKVTVMQHSDGTFSVHNDEGDDDSAATLDEAAEKAQQLALMGQYDALDRARKEQAIRTEAKKYGKNTVYYPTMADAANGIESAIRQDGAALGLTSVAELRNPAVQDRDAFYTPDGTAVVILDNVVGVSDIPRILAHEHVGHGGPNGEFGGRSGAQVVFAENIRSKEFEAFKRRIADGLFPHLKANMDEINSHLGEVFAHYASVNLDKNPNALDKLASKANDILRKYNLRKTFSASDVKVLMARWRDAAKGGGNEPIGMGKGNRFDFFPVETQKTHAEAPGAQGESVTDNVPSEGANAPVGDSGGADGVPEPAPRRQASAEEVVANAKMPFSEAEKATLESAADVTGIDADGEVPAAGDFLSVLSADAPIVRLNPAKVDRSDAVLPNMKKDANRTSGITKPLEGEWHPTMGGIGAAWLTKDGRLVVITGRHRSELAERKGKSMLYYLYREADGFTKEQAEIYDAIANIHDEKGTIDDYIKFLDKASLTRDAAEKAGILSGKGLVAWSLYADATDAVRSATALDGNPEDGQITPTVANIIAQAAPKDANPRNPSIQKRLLEVAKSGRVKGKAFEMFAKMRTAELQKQKINENLLVGEQMSLFDSPEDVAADLLAAKQSQYRTKKAEAYEEVAKNIRSALNKEGRLELTKEFADELGVTDKNDRKQLETAYDKAAEKARYWSEAVRLDDADQQTMDATINAAADARAKKLAELKAKREAAKSGVVDEKKTTAPKVVQPAEPETKAVAQPVDEDKAAETKTVQAPVPPSAMPETETPVLETTKPKTETTKPKTETPKPKTPPVRESRTTEKPTTASAAQTQTTAEEPDPAMVERIFANTTFQGGNRAAKIKAIVDTWRQIRGMVRPGEEIDIAKIYEKIGSRDAVDRALGYPDLFTGKRWDGRQEYEDNGFGKYKVTRPQEERQKTEKSATSQESRQVEQKPKKRTVKLKDEAAEKKAKDILDSLDFDTPELAATSRYQKWVNKYGINAAKEKNQKEWARKNRVDFDSPEFDYEKFGKLVAGVGRLVDVLTESGHRDFKALATYIRENDAEKFERAKPVLQDVWNAVAKAKKLERVSDSQAEQIYGIILAAERGEEKTNGSVQESGPSNDGGDKGVQGVRPAGSAGTPPAGERGSVAPEHGAVGAKGVVRDNGERRAESVPVVGHEVRQPVPELHANAAAGDGKGTPEAAVGGGRSDGVGGRRAEGGEPRLGLESGERDQLDGRGSGTGTVAATEPAEAAHKVVPEKPSNYVITKEDGEWLENSKPSEKVANNIDVLNILNALEEESRAPTPKEKTKLARYVGFGGFPQIFADEYERAFEKYGDKPSGELPVQTQAALRKLRFGLKGYDYYRELKNLLSPSEINSMRRAMLDAFYTPIEMCRAIHKALRAAGFNGGRMLETSAGTGNFVGTGEYDNPPAWTAVELDKTTGKILKHLYPLANVKIQGFEVTPIPPNFMDAVVSNVPFGDTHLHDPEYNKLNFRIHDYFIARAVDRLHVGGVAALLTSHGTLDKADKSLIRYLEEHGGKIVGSVRLPNGHQEKNAGTQVSADVIFIQKVAGRADNAIYAKNDTVAGMPINAYYVAHPEMIFGTPEKGRSMYGAGDELKIRPTRDMAELGDVVAKAAEGLKYVPAEQVANADPVELDVDDSGLRKGNVTVKGGKVMRREGDMLVPIDAEVAKIRWPKRFEAKGHTLMGAIGDMMKLRDAYHAYIDAQKNGTEDDVMHKRYTLNGIYDTMIAKYKTFNGDKAMSQLFNLDDADGIALQQLEAFDEVPDGETATGKPKKKKINFRKSDTLKKRTLFGGTKATKADNVLDGLRISLNESGRVNVPRIAELTGKGEADVRKELAESGMVFQNPSTGGLETRDEYLSGAVRRKLREAKAAADVDSAFRKNVEELEKVQPPDKPATSIKFQLGQQYIPDEMYRAFFAEKVWGCPVSHVTVGYDHKRETWVIGTKSAPNMEWERRSPIPFPDLLERMFNGSPLTIKDRVDDGDGKYHYVLNPEKTQQAEQLRDELTAEISKWLVATPERAAQIERAYNDKMNDNVERKWDPELITLDGISDTWAARANTPGYEHQKRTIARGVLGGNLCIAHCVGAGKSFEMFSICMQLRRLGLARKPLMTVPNHMVESGQIYREFKEAYPGARILVAHKSDLSSANRKRFLAKAANGDWDCIVLAHSSFSLIGMDPKVQAEYIEQEINDLRELLMAEKASDKKSRGNAAKRIEKKIRSKEERMKKLLDASKKDTTVPFENIGVDYILVDEAHNFKGLDITTRMQNVSGVSGAKSRRAQDMEMKARYLAKLHGSDRGLIFASGTIISNSISEMYTTMRFLAPEKMREMGIYRFDDWAKVFGVVETKPMPRASGKGYQEKTRFAKFQNLIEMKRFFHSFSDVVLDEDLKIPRPFMIGGKPIVHRIAADPVQVAKVEELDKRLDSFKGKYDPKVDNPLKVVTEGRLVAIDPSLLGIPGSEHRRLNAAADEIYRIWQKSKGKAAKDGKTILDGTQLVFCDSGVPKEKKFKKVYRTSGGGFATRFGNYWTFSVSGVDADGFRHAVAVRSDGAKFTPKPFHDHGNESTEDISTVYAAFEEMAQTAEEYSKAKKIESEGLGLKKYQESVLGRKLDARLPRAVEPQGEAFDINAWIDENAEAVGYDIRLENPFVNERQSAPDEIDLDEEESAEDNSDLEESGDDEEAEEENDADAAANAGIENMLRGKFNVYSYLKKLLVQRGIPAEEIAFIHDAANADMKRALFADFNGDATAYRGGKRILIGNTPKMGEGANVQKRLVAIHHLDVPWKPAWLIQRDGRGIRAGNLNAEIGIHRYVTEGTFDVYSYDKVSTKQQFINQAMDHDMTTDEVEDVDDAVLSAEEAKAAAAGPMGKFMLERVHLGENIRKSELKMFNQRADVARAENAVRQDQSHLDSLIEAADKVRKQIDEFKAKKGDQPFGIEVAPDTQGEFAGKTLAENDQIASYFAKKVNEFVWNGKEDGIIGRLYGMPVWWKETRANGMRIGAIVVNSIGAQANVEIFNSVAIISKATVSSFKAAVTRATSPDAVDYWEAKITAARKALDNSIATLAKTTVDETLPAKIGDMKVRLAEVNNVLGIKDENVRKAAERILNDRIQADREAEAVAIAAVPEAEREAEAEARYEEALVDFDSPSLAETEQLEKEIANGDYYVTYRAMENIPGVGLVPPMASLINGKYNEPMHEGDWFKPSVRPDLVPSEGPHAGHFPLRYRVINQKTGKKKIQTTWVAPNFYLHSSTNPFNDQFKAAHNRPNMVVVRMLVPKSATRGEKIHPIAKDAPGFISWKSGPVADQLKQLGKPERKVLLSNYGKIDKVLSWKEVVDVFDEIAGDAKGRLAIPEEVMPPGLRDEIASRGYNIVPRQQIDFDSPSLSPTEAEYAGREDKTPTEEVMRDVFGMTNAEIATALKAAEMEPPKHTVKKDETAFKQAEALLSNPSYMAKLSRAVYRVPRPVTDYENIALNTLFRQRQATVNALQTRLDALQGVLDGFDAVPKDERDAEFNAERDKAVIDVRETRQDLDQAKALMREAGQAARQGASEQGRALRSNRFLLDAHDYSYAGITAQIADALGGAEKITPEMDERIKEIARDFAQLDETSRELATVRLKAQSEKILADIKNGGKVRKATERKAGDEAKRVTRNYMDALAQIEVGAVETGGTLIGLTDQQYPAWGRYLRAIGEYHCFMNPNISEEEMIAAIVADVSPFIQTNADGVRDALTGFGHNFRQSRYDSQRLMNDLRAQARLKRQLDWMDETNTMPPVTGLVRDEPSQLTRELQKEVQARKAEIPDSGRDERRLKSFLDTAKTRVKNRIADLEKAIATGEAIPGRERSVREDLELRDLRQRRDELQKEYDGIFGESHEMTDQQRIALTEKMLAKSLERAMEDLARAQSGDFSKRPQRPGVTSPTIDAIRARIADTRAQILELKRAKLAFGLTPEEIAARNARKLANREKALLRLAERIANGDLRPVAKPQPPMTKDEQKRYDEMGEQMKRARQKLADMRLEAENATAPTFVRKAGEYLRFVTTAQRALRATMDFSAVLRQAARITLAHPIMGAKAFGKAWNAAHSDANLMAVNDEIMSDPTVQEAVAKYGLHLREVDAANARDVEMFHGMERNKVRIFGKEFGITEIPFFGKFMLKSERHYITYLNAASAELYSAIVNDRSRFPGGATQWQKKMVADMINIWNGSAAISKERRQALQKAWVNDIFWAPGLAISRAQTAALYDVWRPLVAKGVKNPETGGYDSVSPDERKTLFKIGASEHIKSSLAMIALGALLKWLFADEDDWYNFEQADWFEKLMMLASPKVGNTTIDLTGGEQSVYRLAHQVAKKEKKTGSGRTVKFGGFGAPTVMSSVQRFMEGKTAPWLSELAALWEGRDYVGDDYTWKKAVMGAAVPLTFEDMYDQLEQNGVGASLVTIPLTLLGAGGSTYDRKPYENVVNPFVEAKREYDAVANDATLSYAERQAKMSEMRSDNPLLADTVRGELESRLKTIRQFENMQKKIDASGGAPNATITESIERQKSAILKLIRSARK